MEQLAALWPLLILALLFWLLVIRPTSRRQKEARRMQESLVVGQRVMLTSGLFGIITALEEDEARLEIAAGVEVEVVRGAIATVATSDSPEEPEASTEPGQSGQ